MKKCKLCNAPATRFVLIKFIAKYLCDECFENVFNSQVRFYQGSKMLNKS